MNTFKSLPRGRKIPTKEVEVVIVWLEAEPQPISVSAFNETLARQVAEARRPAAAESKPTPGQDRATLQIPAGLD